MEAFKRKYGINIEFVVGRYGELTQKILSERAAGLKLGDFYMEGEVPDSSLFDTGP